MHLTRPTASGQTPTRKAALCGYTGLKAESSATHVRLLLTAWSLSGVLGRLDLELLTASRDRITVSCEGIPPEQWPEAVSDIREEFHSRQWHHIVDIRWSGDTLLMTAENDYDLDGAALADEFSDTVAAYALGLHGYSVSIVSVAKRDESAS